MAYLDPNIPLRLPQVPTVAEQAQTAFQLGDIVKKQRAQQQQRQDSTNLQQYLKEGGNLDTPEGITKALEWARAGNVSLQTYQTMAQAGRDMQESERKKIEQLAKMDQLQLENVGKRFDLIAQSAAPLMTTYEKRKGEVGDQQASEEFKTGLQPVLQGLVQNKVISPQQAQQYADASPAQINSVLQSTNYGRKMVMDAAKLRGVEAGTEADIALRKEREARTKQILEGKPAGRAAKGGGAGSEATPGGIGSDTFQDQATGQRYIVNKRTGKAWEANDDGTFKQIPLKNVPEKVVPMGKIGTMGSIESRFTQRVLLSANEALRDLQNVSELPITVSSGIFGGRQQGPGLLDATKEVLANTMTQEETQLYNTMSTGFQRSLAAIEAAGLMPTGSLTHQMDAVIFKEGDTNLTKMSKLAQTRQIVDAGLEVMEGNPRLSDSEKEQAKRIRQELNQAVPFTQRDVTKWMKASQKNPNITMADVMGKKKSATAEKTEKPAEFRTVAEAQAAANAGKLKSNTKVIIGGRAGTWQ